MKFGPFGPRHPLKNQEQEEPDEQQVDYLLAVALDPAFHGACSEADEPKRRMTHMG
jgi:hypothetical protein